MNIYITICEMNQPALLNIGLLAARKGAVELEFAVKRLHKLKIEKSNIKIIKIRKNKVLTKPYFFLKSFIKKK